jgi:hypothetical protein
MNNGFYIQNYRKNKFKNKHMVLAQKSSFTLQKKR